MFKVFSIAIYFLLAITPHTAAQEKQVAMEIYGAVITDVGYNLDQIHPDWFDVVRPTKLPAFKNEFGTNGNAYFSVRQTRLGFKNHFNTPLGELKTMFEFDLFGVGEDDGQTTIRLQHAYAELGKIGAGQTYSPFMDYDVFPNIVDYWGPSGMAFYRNIQLRYMPIQGDTRLTIALEQPGASADGGKYADRIELIDVLPRFPLPDLSAEYRHAFNWGYLELAGILRRIEWKDINQNNPYDLSGEATGWGLSLSTGINLSESILIHGQGIYGQAIQNYFNDAPIDIGIKNNFSDPARPIVGVPLPVLGVTAFLDIDWNDKLSSSIGYSLVDIDNSDGQIDESFRRGQYIITNLLWYPVENVTMGIEFQWANRQNYKDGWQTSMTKFQFSFNYSFSQLFYQAER